MKREISQSGKLREIRQSQRAVERLTERLRVCPIEQVAEVQRVLFDEKNALRILLGNKPEINCALRSGCIKPTGQCSAVGYCLNDIMLA